MNFHPMKCALCDQQLQIGGSDSKKLYVVCRGCDVWTPLAQVLQFEKDKAIGFTNPLRAKGTEEKRLPKAGRNRLDSKV
jgi:hypothetical protein